MTSKEALKCIIYRLTAQEDDLELRETAKVEIETIKKDLDRLEKLENENFELRQKLNTEEECYVILQKKYEMLKKEIKGEKNNEKTN